MKKLKEGEERRGEEGVKRGAGKNVVSGERNQNIAIGYFTKIRTSYYQYVEYISIVESEIRD